ncbi:thermonuclease family protein [Bacillus safensis subsp. osmophilus]
MTIRRFLWTCIILILLLNITACQQDEQIVKYDATVLRVIDGDTFEAKINDDVERVRLILVDTPETVHPKKKVEPYGVEASNYTKRRLKNKDVRLELDKETRDKYGRLLAYVYVDDREVSFNEELLINGYARIAVYPPNTRYLKEYEESEKKAKKERIGLWKVD